MTQAAPRWGQMQRTDHIPVPAQAQTPEVTVGRSPPPERRFLHLRSQMVRPVPDDVQRLLRHAGAQRICAVAPSHPGEAGPAARGGGLTTPGGDRPCAPVHCLGLHSPVATGERGASRRQVPPPPPRPQQLPTAVAQTADSGARPSSPSADADSGTTPATGTANTRLLGCQLVRLEGHVALDPEL